MRTCFFKNLPKFGSISGDEKWTPIINNWHQTDPLSSGDEKRKKTKESRRPLHLKDEDEVSKNLKINMASTSGTRVEIRMFEMM